MKIVEIFFVTLTLVALGAAKTEDDEFNVNNITWESYKVK